MQRGRRGGSIPNVARDSDILNVLRSTLHERQEILDAYVFGSVARGDSTDHSDIDVAVYVEDRELRSREGFGYQAELTTDLMKALARNDVDVVVLNNAPPLLYHRVLRDGVRIVARDLRATTTREGRALSRYCDYAVQLRKIDDALRARIERGEFGK
ncbi:MAG: nucleotidyltransferase domain-containing protein [Deltaproteobacteria bacterium]|nr:MAG: nucleotidyltransferase domain-containing protein [Deltaproteobacteria bacterium]